MEGLIFENSSNKRISFKSILPFKDVLHLESFNEYFGQKVLYQALVDEFGRDEAIRILSEAVPEEVATLQVNVLTSGRTTEVEA